ncbi:MAG TPA: sulfurtransferase [Chloroflexia bacterium]|nr:sulfurtransferase [Chloroflexia bacterium]
MLDFEQNPLVETDWLASHLNDPDLRIVDARWRGDGTSSRELYKAGHIPEAIHLDWELDLSYVDQKGLRYMLLPPQRFEEVMSAAGIGNDSRVVAYADYDYSGATRLWWALRYYGHRQVTVLNGGWNKWVCEKRPVTKAIPQPSPASFSCIPRANWLATHQEIIEALQKQDTGVRLVDTRPPEQFAGKAVWTPPGSHYLPPDAESVDIGARVPMRAGHIPSAINLTSSYNLNLEDWTYLPADVIRVRAEAAGLKPDQRVITYCGVGISASLGLFSLHLAGYKDLALYDASWEEWGTELHLPVE